MDTTSQKSPPPPGKREQTKLQNRQLILAAARGVFAELGYHSPWDLPLEPYLGIANVSSGQGAFVETGGTAALSGAVVLI